MSCVSANIDQAYTGYATVNYGGHGLTDNSAVYIRSDVEDYNGLWYVDVQDANKFFIKRYTESNAQVHIVDAIIELCFVTVDNKWSSVHLPITYFLTSDRYPTNEIDTERVILTRADDTGYTRITLNGAIYATDNNYSHVKITNAITSGLNGIYRVLAKYSSTNIVIDLAYDIDNIITGANIQVYYNNYAMNVRVYAGLNNAHPWAFMKPYTLIGELRLIPDSSNEMVFSINELLKSKINHRNNTLLATLPVNLDFFTQFYIEYAESYDVLSVYDLVTTFTDTFTTDDFQGFAANAMLAFKNVYSGFMSEYVMVSNTSKFLTLFDEPVLFACPSGVSCYQDISFILPEFVGASSISIGDVSDWVTLVSGGGSYPWNAMGNSPRAVTIPVSGSVSNYIGSLITNPYLGTYTFRITISGSATGPGGTNADVYIYLGDDPFSILQIVGPIQVPNGVGLTNYEVSITESVTLPSYIALAVQSKSGSFPGDPVSNTITLSSFSPAADYDYTIALRKQFYLNGNLVSTVDEGLPDYGEGIYRIPISVDCNYDRLDVSLLKEGYEGVEQISETKTFKIDCECANQEVRLTWLNNLGGFDYWVFRAETTHDINIKETGVVNKPIFPNWPMSYGEFADTRSQQTYRKTGERKTLRSQHLTLQQLEALKYIKSSTIVQIINTRRDKRTVIVDENTFTAYQDGDDLYTITFQIDYTDDIPSQRI